MDEIKKSGASLTHLGTSHHHPYLLVLLSTLFGSKPGIDVSRPHGSESKPNILSSESNAKTIFLS
jgi:hypothetical protein